MADNKLKQKAMGNHFNRMGWYSGEMSGEIEPSAANNEAIKHQEPQTRKKFVRVGKAKVRIKGM